MSNNHHLDLDQIRKLYYRRSKDTSHIGYSLKDRFSSSALSVIEEARQRISAQKALDSEAIIDEKQLSDLVSSVESNRDLLLSSRERNAVIAALDNSLCDFDILTPLVEHPEINDIIVRSHNDISVQINRKNIQSDLEFPSHQHYVSFIENLAKRAGKACTVATPVVDATLDSNVRVCITHQSFSPPGSGPMLTLRMARHTNSSLNALERSGLAPSMILDYLGFMVSKARTTLLIAGEVGVGKTTLVKALAQEIAEEEAILIIEDTHEINLSRRFVRNLLTREDNTEGAGRIKPAQAIRTGMRMAMNRIILGEMRDAEAAEAFVDVSASGHPGLSTIHARSAKDALARLELFLLRAQRGVDVHCIRRQISNALSAIVFLGLDRISSRRRILEVVEVGSSSEGTIAMAPIFSFRQGATPVWLRESGVSSFKTQMEETNLDLGKRGQQIELNPDVAYVFEQVN